VFRFLLGKPLSLPVSIASLVSLSPKSNSTTLIRLSNPSPSAIVNQSPRSQLIIGEKSRKNNKSPSLPSGKDMKVISPSTLTHVPAPILGQSNVRYIGQPNGKLQKIVYVQTPVSSMTSSINKNPLSRSASKISIGRAVLSPQQMSQHIPLLRGVAPSALRPVLSSAQSQRNIVPVFVNPQGVPLQFARPSVGSSTFTTATNNISSVRKVAVTVTKPLAPSQILVKAPRVNSVNSQNLQGLKKAVQQVAAVTQINAKLQNHLGNKTQTQGSFSVKTPNKVTISSLPNDQVLKSPLTLKVPVSIKSSPSTMIPSTIASSPVRSIGISQSHLIDPNKAGISFILTSNGLVSVNIPPVITSQVATKPLTSNIASTQNIITSRLPSHFQSSPASIVTSHAAISKSSKNNLLIDKNIDKSPPVTSMKSTTITPEKLRDAEALLGLINPMHHLPAKPSNNVIPVGNKIVSPLPALKSIAPQIKHTSLPLTQPVSVASSLQLKIQMPSLQQLPVRTAISSSMRSTLPQSQNSTHQQIPSPFKSIDHNTDASFPGINPRIVATPKTSSATTTQHKMVVDAAQLLKLREEGKVVVTPNGQMFLVTNPSVSKNGSLR